MTSTIVDLQTLRTQHRAAMVSKEQAGARLDVAERRERELRGNLSASDLGARLNAKVELPVLEGEALKLLQAAVEADRVELELREAIKRARHDELFAEKKPVIAGLAKLLLAARPYADRLAEIEEAEGAEVGVVYDHLLWVSLQSRTATFEPLLDHWLARCREYLLLE